MQVGFTGTRDGMTRDQTVIVATILVELGTTWFHHGDCVGADAEAHALALATNARVVIHPPADEEHRARCQGSTVMLAPLTHFARNRAIVTDTKALVAAPKLMQEMPKGGTWYTINYARKLGHPIFIVWPDGTVTRENMP
jgi:predicted Rossmann fold nucleotide-binding protein DprA/Smf involved in DNA uptake